MTAAKENISEVYIDILQSKHLLFETLQSKLKLI